jgi:hypothetical protein
MIWGGFEADLTYYFAQSEIKTGLSYNVSIPSIPFRIRADLSYANFKDFRFIDRVNDLFPLVAFQAGPLFDFLVLNANLGYDIYNLNLGCGAGIDFILPLDMHIMAEIVFPILYWGTNGNEGSAVFISAGYKIEIGGHHFIFTIANSPTLDVRRLTLGCRRLRPLVLRVYDPEALPAHLMRKLLIQSRIPGIDAIGLKLSNYKCL